MWGAFTSLYDRLEARYYNIDLMECSLRRALNLTYELLVEMNQHSQEAWDKLQDAMYPKPDHDVIVVDKLPATRLTIAEGKPL